ncbi:hypothetical protein [Bacillus sp. RAR_GA_16]|nr:hypothetical protein [Bacillus sp. RAR_GA_16]
MDILALIGVLLASGIAIFLTVSYSNKAYHRFLHANKGLNQNTVL